MENSNAKADTNSEADPAPCAGEEQNPTNYQPNGEDTAANRPRRTPFTDLSQEDADLALARTLQEQERAYMMLRMDAGEGSDYGSWEANSYDLEYEMGEDDYDDATEDDDIDGSDVDVDDEAEDAFDVHARAEEIEDDDQNIELDPSAYSSDEAYARALQDAEEREMAARLLALAGLNENAMVIAEDEELEGDEDEEDEEDEHDGNPQDAWDEVDPDELSYEELLALGDVVGTESRGLSADTIASLPSIHYKSPATGEGSCDSCVICRLDYEDGDTLTVLLCKHSYHLDCINDWLKINKVCPVCNAEVSTT